MGSADPGKHGSGWQAACLSIPRIAFFNQKVGDHIKWMEKVEAKPYLSCISFIHNRMPRHRGLKLKLNF